MCFKLYLLHELQIVHILMDHAVAKLWMFALTLSRTGHDRTECIIPARARWLSPPRPPRSRLFATERVASHRGVEEAR